MKPNQIESAVSKFGLSKLLLLIGLGVVLVIIVAGIFLVARSASPKQNAKSSTPMAGQGTSKKTAISMNQSKTITWQQMENGWQASDTPPACPDPLFEKPPVDLTEVTSILYPGQTRGNDYKPHGGFRFDNRKDNNISVKAPITAQVVDGARYLVEGEMQYTFDFIAPCGMMYRLGHLLELTPKFQQLVDKFPAAAEGDSRTTRIEPPVDVSFGEEIATAIGVTKGNNVFVDWGVYDLKSKNEASKDQQWAAQHDPMLAPYALCWLDFLMPADSTKAKSLPPSDPKSGKTSDYCN